MIFKEEPPQRIIRHVCPNGSKRRNVVIQTREKFWNERVRHHLPEHRHSAFTLTISGAFGMFTDISSQPSSPVSYPVPTSGALVNILRHICPHLKTTFIPLGVEILNPIQYAKFSFNLSGTGRKAPHEKKETNSMFHHMILRRPRFRIYFALVGKTPQLTGASIQTLQQKVKGGGKGRDLFMGQRDYPLDLEYTNPDEPIQTKENFILPSMLKEVLYRTSQIAVFSNVTCERGRVVFPTRATII